MRQVTIGAATIINPESRGKDFPYSLIEYIDISSIGSGELIESPKQLESRSAPSRAKRLVRHGDTILSTVRPNLRTFLYIREPDPKTVVSTGFAVVRARPGHDARFIYYALTNRVFTGYLTANAKGTSYPAVDVAILERGLINTFDLAIQTRIADILSAYDDLIENNNRRMALLEEAIHLLYREWFVYLRFPGHERVEVVDGVPEGWEKTTLSNVCDVNGASISKRNAPRTINYVDIRSVTTGHIDEVQEMDFEGAPSRARRIVRDGDIIWATVRPGNRAYTLVLNPVENLIASTGFAVLTPTQVPSSFLYPAVTTDWFVAHMKAIAGGAAYPAVKPPDFEAYELLIPTRQLLKDFDEVAARSFQQMRRLNQQNQRLREARDLLLPRLMDGRVPV